MFIKTSFHDVPSSSHLRLRTFYEYCYLAEGAPNAFLIESYEGFGTPYVETVPHGD